MVSNIRILFVCHKNISVSPLAEKIFSHIIRKRKILDRFTISSAGILDELPQGQSLTANAKLYLEKAGVNVGVHSAKRLTSDMAEQYDWILCSTEFARRKCFDILKYDAVYVTPKDVRFVFKMDPASPISIDGKMKPRVCCLMDFTGCPRDIIDPEVTKDYRFAFNEITLGCNAFLSLALK